MRMHRRHLVIFCSFSHWQLTEGEGSGCSFRFVGLGLKDLEVSIFSESEMHAGLWRSVKRLYASSGPATDQ